jgi:O-antigen/teichoic acid export membrane protein
MSGKSPLSRLVSGSSIVFVGQFFSLGISFIGNILIARYLGATELGAISLGILMTSTLTTVALLGTDTGISRYLSRDDSIRYKKSVIQMSLKLSFPLSLIIAIITYFNSTMISTVIFDAPSLFPVIEIFALAIPISVLHASFLSGVRGLGKPIGKVVANDIALPGVKILLISLVIYLGLGEVGLSWAYLLSFVVSGALLGYLVIDELGIRVRGESGPMIKPYMKYSAPLMLTSLMTMGFANIDRFFISQFGTVELVGIYSGIYNLTKMLLIVMNSVNFLFLPIFSRLQSNDNLREMSAVYETTTKWIVALSLPLLVVFIMFPTTVIEITYGGDFLSGRLTLVVLSLGVATHIFSGLNRSALKALGQTKKVTYGTAGVFTLNVVLNLLLVPRYSITGAALATTGSYLLWNLYYLLVLSNEIDVRIISTRDLKFFIFSGLIMFLVGLILKVLMHDTLLSTLVFIPIAGLGYSAAVVFLLLSESDIAILNDVNESIGFDISNIITYLERYT